MKNKTYLTLSAVLLSFILLLGAVPTENVFADDDCDDLKGKEKRDCKKQEKDDEDDNGDDDGNDDDDKPKDSKCSRDLKNPLKIKPLCEVFLLLLDLRDAILNNDDETLPSAGTDRFPVIVEIELSNPDFSFEFGLTGSLTMDRSEPFEDGATGKWTIDTEIVSMQLVGEAPEMAKEVNNDLADAASYGATGTPTFFIGNEEDGFIKFVGAQPFTSFQLAIDRLLS